MSVIMSVKCHKSSINSYLIVLFQRGMMTRYVV
nr:MAG TPA: hypothetical protein [Caudoviricetes sp.]